MPGRCGCVLGQANGFYRGFPNVLIRYVADMTSNNQPTINDLLARLYTVRDTAADRVRTKSGSLTGRNAARGMLRSGATLKALVGLIETEFDVALTEILATLRHMQSVPEIDYRACRDQAFLRARDLVPVLRGAADLDKWINMIGRGSAGEMVNAQIEGLYPKIDYRFHQFDVGLDQVNMGFVQRADASVSLQGSAQRPTSVKAPVSGATLGSTDPASVPDLRETRPYQVALSFAGEQRGYVESVAKALAARRIAVFYDAFEANALWGKDGAEHFHQIYSCSTQYVVMFISEAYVSKAWTRHERRAAISRQMKDESEYILPVRFDMTEVPGLPDTMQYLMAERFTPAELAVEIAKKIGTAPTVGKASDLPPPASGALSGEVTFDYAAHDGRYVIGTGGTAFETCWSTASDTSIHLYNDPPSIHGVAIARGANDFTEITDASSYDFTSRTRTPRIGEIAVLQNTNGFFAAVQVLAVENDSQVAASAALTIRYLILPDGSDNFSAAIGKLTGA